MARDYGTISCAFWKDPDFRRLSHDAWTLYFYFRSSAHSSAANAYSLPMAYIIHDTKLENARVVKALGELALRPFALYDAAAEVVALPGLYREKQNRPANPNNAKYMAKFLLALPDCDLKAQAIEELRNECGYGDTVSQTLVGWTYKGSQLAMPLAMPPVLLTPPETPPPPATGRKRNLGTRLPADWKPTEEDIAYATKQGWSAAEIEKEANRFVRYWTGADANKPFKKDWHRTWCNRIDDVGERRSKPNGTNGHAVSNFGVSETPWAARMNDFRRSGLWLSSWGPKPGEPRCAVPAQYLAPVE